MRYLILIFALLLSQVVFSQNNFTAEKIKTDTVQTQQVHFSYPKIDLDDLSKKVKEVYTPEMLKNKIEGKVIIRVLVDIDGSILKHKIITSPSEELSTLALIAVKNSKITPAYKDGSPIGAWANFPVEFKIQ